jgi:hypothetical protein
MAKIKIVDLPKDKKIREEEMKKVLGGKRLVLMESIKKVRRK